MNWLFDCTILSTMKVHESSFCSCFSSGKLWRNVENSLAEMTILPLVRSGILLLEYFHSFYCSSLSSSSLSSLLSLNFYYRCHCCCCRRLISPIVAIVVAGYWYPSSIVSNNNQSNNIIHNRLVRFFLYLNEYSRIYNFNARRNARKANLFWGERKNCSPRHLIHIQNSRLLLWTKANSKMTKPTTTPANDLWIFSIKYVHNWHNFWKRTLHFIYL